MDATAKKPLKSTVSSVLFFFIIFVVLLSSSGLAVPIYTPLLSVDLDGNSGTTAAGWDGWDIAFAPASPITNTFGAINVEIAFVGTGTGGRDRDTGALEPLDDFIYANRNEALGLGQHYLAVEFTGLDADAWYELTFLAQDPSNASTQSYMAFDVLNPADYLYNGANNNYQPAAGGINVNDEPGVNGSTNPFYGTLLGRTVIGGGAAGNIYDYSDSFFVKTDGTGTVTIYAWNDSEDYTGTQLVSLLNGFEIGTPPDFTWDGSEDNSFSTANNWADGIAPVSGDIYAAFNFGADDVGDRTVTGADGAYTNVLGISFNGALGDYSISGSGSFSMYSGAEIGGNSDLTHTLDVDLVSNGSGGIVVNGTDSITIAGDISGAGGLTQASSGELVLSGTNTYSGGTLVSSGTLVGTTSSLQGDIENNADVVFQQDADGTYAGDMDGTGAMTKLGTGNVTLSGTNSYSGGTTVTAGTLTGDTDSLQGAITNNAAVVFNQSTTGTYSGDMDGSGSLTKLGTGNVTLSGTNSYSGGTTVTAGILTGTTGSLQGNITNNATVAFNQDADGEYSDDMSGTGALTKLGTGNVTLSGTNTYEGGTTVSAGTLTGTTDSVQGDITNNSAVVINQDTDGEYAGNMSGTGTLTKDGTGNLTLSGTNPYSGGTTVNAGTLTGTILSLQGNITNNAEVVFDQDSVGIYAGSITGTGAVTKLGTGNVILTGTHSYEGGTLISEGTLTGTTSSLQGDIENNAALVFNQSTTGTFADVISGTGTLTKSGSGRVNLTGDNLFTGLTTISAGTLNLSGQLFGNVTVNGGVLMGTGLISNGANLTLNGGTFRPGASIGTMTVTGDYVQNSGSTLEVEIYKDEFDALTSDLLIAATATLESGSIIHVIDLTPEERAIMTGDQFTIISAAGDITDEGATITSSSAVLSFTGSIVGNDYILEALRRAFGEAGRGANNTALLNAIDSDMGTAAYAGDYVTLVNELTNLTPGQLNAAAEQMLPTAHASSASFTNTINQRLSQNLGGYLSGRRKNSSLWSMQDSLSNSSKLLLADASGNPEVLGYVMRENEKRQQAEDNQDGKSRNFFIRPFGVFYRQDSTSQSSGFSAQSVGAHFGVDENISDNFILGIGGAYAHSFIKFNSGLGEADIDSFRIGPYFTYYKNNWFIDGSVTLGYHLNKTSRDIRFGGIDRTAKSRYDAYDISTFITAGYDIFYENWTLTPSASMQYSCYRNEKFKESGAGAAGLVVDAQTQQLLLGSLGLRLHTVTRLLDFKVAPEIFVGYSHRFTDDDSMNARFVNGVTKFSTNIDTDKTDSVYYGAGLSSLLTERISAFVRYEGEAYSGNKSNSLNLGFTITF